jgi:hypothetical protein
MTWLHTTPLAIQWNLLQLVTIPGWVGIGVAIPFPMLVEVVVIGGGVLVADGVTAGFDEEVASVEEVNIIEDFVDEAWLVVGAGSFIASTQYEFPTTRFP